jgi:diguanylate cyclase (GGDEF)-like protein
VQSEIVPVTAGLGPAGFFGTAAAICLVPAVFAAVMLVRGVPARPSTARVGFTLLSAAAGAGLIALAATTLALATTGAGHLPLIVAGIGFGAAAALMGAGLLLSPTVVALESRLAHALDGTLLALGVLYVAWVGFLASWYHRADGADGPVFALLAGPLVLTAAVVGMAVVTAAPRIRLPTCALSICVGTGLFGIGAIGVLAASAGRAGGAVFVGGCAAVSLGTLALAGATRCRERASVGPARAANPTWLSLAAVGLAIGATVVRVASGNELDAVSIALAICIGGFLTAQQMVAQRAIARIARRLADSEAHFRRIAHTDPLTDLANRRELLRQLENEAAGGPPCVLLSIDLDGFKDINDIRGHDVGDAVLVEVARRLRTNVRPGDCAARLGGDEFAVLMWAQPSEATSVADRLLAVLKSPYELATGTVYVTASIGLAGCAEADSVDSLLRNADLALRFAKQSGKDRIEAYDVVYDALVRRHNELEQELRGAVQRGELMLVYQPVVVVRTGEVAGVEALLRWHHPRLGSVPPAEFIPLAEESGLIHDLGRFVVHEAVHQLSRWLADGHEVWMSVNASVRELHRPEYVQQIADVLRQHRVPAQRLTIEITEHAAALDAMQLVDRLTALRASGVRVAIDDFGSEYSSLKLLRTLPVDALKIDRELLDNETTGDHPPIMDVVVMIGQRLGLDVVAEGVATPEQRALLAGYGCTYAQGQWFGRPMPAEHVEALFRHVGEVDSGREIRHG